MFRTARNKPTKLTVLACGLLLAAAPAFAGEGDENLDVEIVPDPAPKAGQAAAFKVRLQPKNGFHINPDAPLGTVIKGTVTASADVKVAKDKLTGDDFTDPRGKPEIALQVTPAKPGEYELKTEFRVIICTDAVCQRPTITKTTKFAVK